MILTVGNTKGGVGKTTLAVNLAILRAAEGRDVLLVDGDEQNTASIFTELRTEQLGRAGYTAISLQGGALRTQVQQLAPKYDDIIIDVGGRNTNSLRAALISSEVVLIPLLPRSFDVWAADDVMKVVEEARSLNPKLKAVAILNAADAQGKDNEEAAQAVREMEGLELLDLTIGRRKAFSNAVATGRGVIEHTPKDAKAIEELQTLARELYASELVS